MNCSSCNALMPLTARVCPLCGTARPDEPWSDERAARLESAPTPLWKRVLKCLALTIVAYIGTQFAAMMALIVVAFGVTGPSVNVIAVGFWLVAMAAFVVLTVAIWTREFKSEARPY